MKTVKEFKDAGLVFVDGDTRTSWVEGHGDVQMTGKLLPNLVANNSVLSERVTKFAWRDNTGENLGFNGRIEIKMGNDTIENVQCSYLTVLSRMYVAWRPYLEVEEVKEETKFENGDVVYANGIKCVYGCPNPSRLGFSICVSEYGHTLNVADEILSKTKPKTDEELLIDELAKELHSVDVYASGDWDSVCHQYKQNYREQAKIVVNLGYRKP